MDRAQIVELINQRAVAAGLDPRMVVRVAELESSLRPQVKNPRSTARGLFQLTDLRKRELGIPLKKQYSIEEQIDHGVLSLAEAQKYLEDRLGRKPQPYEVYAAHFSGPAGSMKVLSASPEARAEALYSRKAMRANPTLKGMTAGVIRQQWQDKFGGIGQEAPRPVQKRMTPQEIERHVVPDPMLDNVPNWEQIGYGQLMAQAEPDQEFGQEPVMLAGGGEVQDDEDESPLNQKLARMVQMARTDEDFRRINEMLAGPRPAGFAKGGEVEDEPTAEELEEASKPSFRTSSAGGGRRKGDVSKALESGTAAREMLRGATMLPQNILGAPVDVATMAMRPFGYSVEKPVMGSEWLKEKSRQAGVAYAPSGTQAERGFFTAGDVLSNLVNPAGATRTAVRGAQQTGQAARELAAVVEANARAQDPFFAGKAGAQRGAVRPPGGGVPALPEGPLPKQANEAITNMVAWLAKGVEEARYEIAPPETRAAMENFWRTKASNYMTRQFGTPDDPIFKKVVSGEIATPQLEKEFRRYAIRAAKEGKTRVDPATGREMFYPKDPEAMEDLTRRYDELTGIRPTVFAANPEAMFDPGITAWMGRGAEQLAASKREGITDKLIEAGLRPELINVPHVNVAARSPEGKMMASAYETKLPERLQQGAEFVGPGREGRLTSSETLRRAMANEEPIFDINPQAPLRDILSPGNINEYLATLTPKEINKTRFEDIVKDTAKFHMKKFEYDTLIADIKAGKRVNDKFFSEGVSAPVLQFQEGPLEGFAWKRIKESKATVPEGAYLGHSVGGYELGGPTYTSTKRQGFKDGTMQIYTLRDNRNRPVTTVEVEVTDGRPIVTQIKGRGRATGNVDPGPYGQAVEQFFRERLRPVRIAESDAYLTPNLVEYKKLLVEDQIRENTRRHMEEMRALGALD
jgi:hypothetical protein